MIIKNQKNRITKLFKFLKIMDNTIQKNIHASFKEIRFQISEVHDPYLSIQFNTPLFHEIIIQVQEEDEYEYFTFFANCIYWFRVNTNHVKVIEKIIEGLLQVTEIPEVSNN